ncbi:hypothetical protein COU01_02005 [Candidatus Falkowbacteria bacterium CG10_big_fil_rev_8_21_14_0_10_44_15]|uniref:Uncharacterized protein n=1 Tax=Candidatus Falkowbacteria bacterium CG10_big_fil_rev_8_21_14_0_10_44_15 TaxID=1974569 RepID=A0A2H0UZY3_9BACT|nr:MAG: hypothetical protein COU01_02005 [Candidatus Falkowbacteria bacterium CG10_big_fil_rev_8_21_14_0_10_44_15]
MFNSLGNVFLFLIWPLFILLSAGVFIKGWRVYRLTKDALVGRITKALIYTILVDISSLGVIYILYLLNRQGQSEGDYFLFAVLGVWFIVFIWSLGTLTRAQAELKGIVEQKK